MVEPVQAFMADDGSIHRTKLEAAKQDARTQLKKLNLFNEGTIIAVLDHAPELIAVLQPIADEEAPNALNA